MRFAANLRNLLRTVNHWRDLGCEKAARQNGSFDYGAWRSRCKAARGKEVMNRAHSRRFARFEGLVRSRQSRLAGDCVCLSTDFVPANELSQVVTELGQRIGLVAERILEQNLTLAAIARQLPAQSVLADFVQYRRCNFAVRTNQRKGNRALGREFRRVRGPGLYVADCRPRAPTRRVPRDGQPGF